MRVLEINGVEKSFRTPQGPVPVLNGVSLSLERGQSLALMGESGSGKSTLLHIAAGLEPCDAGSVEVDGVAVTGAGDAARAAVRRDRIGIVFQQFTLVPSLNVGGNLALQARLAGRHDLDWTDALAKRLGLDDLRDRYPEQLSGGQQQRVAIGRALAARPAYVLADEPTGNLDQATGDAVIALAQELIAEAGCGFLVVTHSARLAQRLDRCLTLDAGRLA
ncbi:MAG: ABC transporter ATP-binding protein [Pseudomonadota bacterium]